MGLEFLVAVGKRTMPIYTDSGKSISVFTLTLTVFLDSHSLPFPRRRNLEVRFLVETQSPSKLALTLQELGTKGRVRPQIVGN